MQPLVCFSWLRYCRVIGCYIGMNRKYETNVTEFWCFLLNIIEFCRFGFLPCVFVRG